MHDMHCANYFNRRCNHILKSVYFKCVENKTNFMPPNLVPGLISQT